MPEFRDKLLGFRDRAEITVESPVAADFRAVVAAEADPVAVVPEVGVEVDRAVAVAAVDAAHKVRTACPGD